MISSTDSRALIASGPEAIVSLGHRHKEFFHPGRDSAGHPRESSPDICEFIATDMFWVFRYAAAPVASVMFLLKFSRE